MAQSGVEPPVSYLPSVVSPVPELDEDEDEENDKDDIQVEEIIQSEDVSPTEEKTEEELYKDKELTPENHTRNQELDIVSTNICVKITIFNMPYSEGTQIRRRVQLSDNSSDNAFRSCTIIRSNSTSRVNDCPHWRRLETH